MILLNEQNLDDDIVYILSVDEITGFIYIIIYVQSISSVNSNIQFSTNDALT